MLWARGNQAWVEQVFSTTLYPALSTIVGYLPSLVDFSIAEWLVVLFPLFCLGYVVYYLYMLVFFKFSVKPAKVQDASEPPKEETDKAAKSEKLESHAKDTDKARKKAKGSGLDTRGMAIYRGVVGAVAIASMVYFLFTFLCGLNYYRYPFVSHTEFSVSQYDVEELDMLCVSLSGEVNVLRAQLEEDPNRTKDFEYYAEHSIRAIENLAEEYPVLQRELYVPPKPVLMSRAMSLVGINGIYFPFTAEPSINAGTSYFTWPASMTHELAHQCGFMREDEAGFIAYLACRQSDEPLVRYSGTLSAFTYAIAELEHINPERASEILSELDEAVQEDIAQGKQYWAEHSSILTDISDGLNDLYLKANDQEGGIESYDRIVDLLIAEQRAAG